MGWRGSNSISYQGKNGGSGKANGIGTILEMKKQLEDYIKKYPKVVSGDKEAISQIKKVKKSTDKVTLYRASPSDRINKGDWVFLSKERAETWSRSLFTKKRKAGYNVIQIQVPANQVQWTGKNLEFAYTGKSKKGVTS